MDKWAEEWMHLVECNSKIQWPEEWEWVVKWAEEWVEWTHLLQLVECNNKMQWVEWVAWE